MEAKHDETPKDEFNATMREMIADGLVVEVSPGVVALTEAGKSRAQDLIASLAAQPQPKDGEVK